MVSVWYLSGKVKENELAMHAFPRFVYSNSSIVLICYLTDISILLFLQMSLSSIIPIILKSYHYLIYIVISKIVL